MDASPQQSVPDDPVGRPLIAIGRQVTTFPHKVLRFVAKANQSPPPSAVFHKSTANRATARLASADAPQTLGAVCNMSTL